MSLRTHRLLAALSAVTVMVGLFVVPSAGANNIKPDRVGFELFEPNPNLNRCLSASPSTTPKVWVSIDRGNRNDKATIYLQGFKEGLQFDLFTVQNTNLTNENTIDPAFKNFGLAWYQTDLEANHQTTIKTILLDQIFGFDPAVSLAPTNTFHVGFWFNNPSDAAPCGFAGPATPFNGEHMAGPLAFITKPNPITGLGPLCTDPSRDKPGTCNP